MAADRAAATRSAMSSALVLLRRPARFPPRHDASVRALTSEYRRNARVFGDMLTPVGEGRVCGP